MSIGMDVSKEPSGSERYDRCMQEHKDSGDDISRRENRLQYFHGDFPSELQLMNKWVQINADNKWVNGTGEERRSKPGRGLAERKFHVSPDKDWSELSREELDSRRLGDITFSRAFSRIRLHGYIKTVNVKVHRLLNKSENVQKVPETDKEFLKFTKSMDKVIWGLEEHKKQVMDLWGKPKEEIQEGFRQILAKRRKKQDGV